MSTTLKKTPSTKQGGNNGRKGSVRVDGRGSARKSRGDQWNSLHKNAVKRSGEHAMGKNPARPNTRSKSDGPGSMERSGQAKGGNASTMPVSNYRHSSHDRANLPTEQTSRYMKDRDRRPVKYRPPARSRFGPVLSWDRNPEACEGETIGLLTDVVVVNPNG